MAKLSVYQIKKIQSSYIYIYFNIYGRGEVIICPTINHTNGREIKTVKYNPLYSSVL